MLKTLLVPFLLFITISGHSANLPKHWHESKGFGTSTQGGLNGEVYKVTNLNSSGAGSLKDAVSKSNRLVVFEVGGVIEGGFTVGSNITVAGQTAPSPGITVIKGNVTAKGSDIVLSHITIQLGSDVKGYPDASNISGGTVVFDHVSVYWGKDETLSMGGVSNVTLYKCIVAEGLQYSGHEDGEHSKGSLINGNCKKLSLIGTLYAHNALRNPRVDGGEIYIANDVVYNWAPGWDHKGPKWSKENPTPTKEAFNVVVSARSGCNVTMVGSVGIQGPESVGTNFLSGHNGSANGYVDDNIIIDPKGNKLSVVDTKTIKVLSKPAIWPEGAEPMPAEEALYEGLRTAGPRPGDRNVHNRRLVKTVADGNGALIDSEEEVGGYPKQSDATHTLNVPDGAAARQAWLDSLEDAIAVDRQIDLSRLYNLVGSKASDKLAGETKALQDNKSIDPCLSVIQNISGNRELVAKLTLPTASKVQVTIFDVAGSAVASNTTKRLAAGISEMVVDIAHLPAGIYLSRYHIGATVLHQKFSRY